MDYASYESIMLRLAEINNMGVVTGKLLKEKAELEMFKQLLDYKNKHKGFLERTDCHTLITPVTQVGKTNSIKQLIGKCLESKTPVIISSDNVEKMYDRICKGLEVGRNFIMYQTNSMFRKRFKTCIKLGQTPVVFCLDNYSQIRNVAQITCMEFSKPHYDKIAIIHDEGGYVTRNHNGYVFDEQGDSQQKWVEYIEFLERVGTSVKRVCITAAPVHYT